MSRKERLEKAEELYYAVSGNLRHIANALSRESSYTFDECMDHLKKAVVNETEKLLGGGR